MTKGQIRQGDVLLVPCYIKPPADAQVCSEVILAEGELTGHVHRLQARTILIWEEQGQRYVHIDSQDIGTLSHEDHNPTPAKVVEPGVTYRVVPQKEWDLSGEWRKVID